MSKKNQTQWVHGLKINHKTDMLIVKFQEVKNLQLWQSQPALFQWQAIFNMLAGIQSTELGPQSIHR